jgi:hypothetical protein
VIPKSIYVSFFFLKGNIVRRDLFSYYVYQLYFNFKIKGLTSEMFGHIKENICMSIFT